MKNDMLKGVYLWIAFLVLVITVGHVSEVSAATKRIEITELVDVLGSNAKLLIDEDARYCRIGLQDNEYEMKIEALPATVFSQEGTTYLSLVSKADELVEGSFNVAKVSLQVSQEGKVLESNYKIEEDGRLLIHVADIKEENPVTITLKGLMLSINRTNPEGYYNLKISDVADYKQDAKVVFGQALVIRTPNTGTIPYVGFTIGEKTYASNMERFGLDADYDIDVAAYRNAQGIAMVPVKYALREQLENVVSSKGVIWFTYYDQRVKVNLQTKTAVIERSKKEKDEDKVVRYTLTAQPEIKEGRLFMAAADIAYIYNNGYDTWHVEEREDYIWIHGMC